MTKPQLLERVMKGELLQVVEYRGTKTEKIVYADKQTKEQKSFDKLSHSVETAHDAFKVDEDTRKIPNFDPSKYVSPFKKGQSVVAVLQSVVQSRDTIEARGHLEPLEA